MKIKKQLVKRSIAGDVLLVPIGSASAELKGLLTLNETASAIWDLLPQCDSAQELVARMLEEYDVDEAVLRADVEDFLAQLRQLDVL